MAMTRICVFAGASPGARPEYAASTRALGEALVEHGASLVYGGGRVGLMGVLADAVLAAGGEVVGVIPAHLATREIAHAGLTELRVVDSMHERKMTMSDLSHGVIAVPGGLGTLEELFEMLTWGQLGLHAKPCGLLQVDGYFDPLLEFLDRMVSERFVRPEHRAMLAAETDPGSLLDRMEAYEAPDTEKWLDRTTS